MKIKIPIDKFKEFSKKLPRNLSQRAFLTFLGLFLIFLIFGIFIFYNFSVVEEKKEIQLPKKPLEFDEEKYQKVLDFWKEREDKFNKIESKTYLDPFQGLTEKATSTIIYFLPLKAPVAQWIEYLPSKPVI